MHWTTYDNLTVYDLWHRRSGHVLNRNIEQTVTIQHSIGLENLVGKNCKRDQNVRRACLRKVHSRIILDQWIRPDSPWAGCIWICIHHPLHQLKDITMLSSSLTATMEWDASMGLKQKNRLLTCPRGGLLRLQTCTSTTRSRDNNGENSSKDLNDFFTSHGVKNYFSISY